MTGFCRKVAIPFVWLFERYKDLGFGPGNKWADLAAHLAGLFSIFMVAAGSYSVFALGQAPDWSGMALFTGGIGTILGARVAKDWVRGKTGE